ncbi:MAG: hypothetical protein G01um101491_128 [Parcubacteria group bacterium Gr01-1014_91]|nr:MAG: hypothetical protein G01um101491_128 [Parcubacteria group bacterium Gr01-1014_91]
MTKMVNSKDGTLIRAAECSDATRYKRQNARETKVTARFNFYTKSVLIRL